MPLFARYVPIAPWLPGRVFGGLSALYAGLHWPERFGCVLSQSGWYLVAA
ncbi:hypothetical protein ACNKHW_03225 [Shigella flexneri]